MSKDTASQLTSRDEAEPQSIPIAFPMDESAPTFGLDQPMQLLGGSALAPEALAMAAGFDHVIGLRTFLAQACWRQVLAGRTWHGHPPLCLVGPSGFGRGLLARRIADLTGTPMIEFDAADLEREVLRTGAGSAVVPMPVLAMALTRCANPTVLLTLTDATPSPCVAQALVKMTDPHRSMRLFDHRLGTVFDISNVSWIIQAPDSSPALLEIVGDYGSVIRSTFGTGPAEDVRRLAVALQAASVGGGGNPTVVESIFSALRDDFPTRGHPTATVLFEYAVNVMRASGFGQ